MAEENKINVINLADSLGEKSKGEQAGIMQSNTQMNAEAAKNVAVQDAPLSAEAPMMNESAHMISNGPTSAPAPTSAAAPMNTPAPLVSADSSESETEASTPEEIKKSTRGLTIELDVIAILIVICLIAIGVVVYYGWFTDSTQTAKIEEVQTVASGEKAADESVIEALATPESTAAAVAPTTANETSANLASPEPVDAGNVPLTTANPRPKVKTSK